MVSSFFDRSGCPNWYAPVTEEPGVSKTVIGPYELQEETDQEVRIVSFGDTIVTLDKARNKIVLDNWGAPSQHAHINEALSRLREQFAWVPEGSVHREDGKLVFSGNSGNVTVVDTPWWDRQKRKLREELGPPR